MSDKQEITIKNIKPICKKFGFEHKERDGKHFATVGEKEVEVKFDDGGVLSSKRNAFRDRARKASAQFLEAYPQGKRSSSKDKNESTQSAAEKPKLDRLFLGSYSIQELEVGMETASDLIDDKKELSELQEDVAGREEESRKLKVLVKVMPEMNYELPDGIGQRIAVLDGEVKEISGKMKKLKKRIESGEPSEEGLAESVPTSSAVEATDEEDCAESVPTCSAVEATDEEDCAESVPTSSAVEAKDESEKPSGPE